MFGHFSTSRPQNAEQQDVWKQIKQLDGMGPLLGALFQIPFVEFGVFPGWLPFAALGLRLKLVAIRVTFRSGREPRLSTFLGKLNLIVPFLACNAGWTSLDIPQVNGKDVGQLPRKSRNGSKESRTASMSKSLYSSTSRLPA